MILIDTSAWVDFFRGKGRFCSSVDQAIESDDAALCGPVMTELRRGLSVAAERKRVLPLLEACHLLDQPADLWNEAGELGRWLRKRGVTVRSLDLLIANYALYHEVSILSGDSDFAQMKEAGLPIVLVDP